MQGKFGRDERIRTSDPHTPSVMRYQAALRPDRLGPADDGTKERALRQAWGGWQADRAGWGRRLDRPLNSLLTAPSDEADGVVGG